MKLTGTGCVSVDATKMKVNICFISEDIWFKGLASPRNPIRISVIYPFEW